MHESNHFGLDLDLVQTLASAAIGQTLVRTFSNVYLNTMRDVVGCLRNGLKSNRLLCCKKDI